ncbi:MAG: alpha/beta fold hydrolase [Pseudomonadota bacterium]
MLHVETYGSGGRPLLILHGLFGSSRNWRALAKRLAADREIRVADLRNHGKSPWFERHTYADMAADLLPFAGDADVIGHSMGGKVAMRLALEHPGAVARLLVADMAPVTYDHDQRQYIYAMQGVDLAAVTTRGDADAQLAAAVPEPMVRAFLLQSLDLGAKRWQLNLDVLERDMGDILGWDWDGPHFAGPALFLSGSESDYVHDTYSPAIEAHFPNAEFHRIEGAGHWLHADKPEAFLAAVHGFFERSSES